MAVGRPERSQLHLVTIINVLPGYGTEVTPEKKASMQLLRESMFDVMDMPT